MRIFSIINKNNIYIKEWKWEGGWRLLTAFGLTPALTILISIQWRFVYRETALYLTKTIYFFYFLPFQPPLFYQPPTTLSLFTPS